MLNHIDLLGGLLDWKQITETSLWVTPPVKFQSKGKFHMLVGVNKL